MLNHIWPWSRIARLEHAITVTETVNECLGEFLAIDRRALKAAREELGTLRAQLAAYRRFDHDGDGKPGGSRKRRAPSGDSRDGAALKINGN